MFGPYSSRLPAPHITLLFALVMMGDARPLHPQSDALAFYSVAEATIAGPPAADSLRVVCTMEVRASDTPIGANGWFSFLAPRSDSSAWIAAFTARRMRRVPDAITTRRLFNPLPTGKPSGSGTLDWAWIWDRNGDGRADYIAYLQNAMGVLPEPLPDSFPAPTRNPDGSFRLTQPFLYALIDAATMVFRHYADDDFDGRVDVAVVEEADLERPMFVRGWVVARSSRHDGVVDHAWAFRHGIHDTTRVLTREADGTYLIPDIPIDGPRTEDAAKRLARGTNLLAAINEVGARCARGPVRIRRP